jgi:hypothetical protein
MSVRLNASVLHHKLINRFNCYVLNTDWESLLAKIHQQTRAF